TTIAADLTAVFKETNISAYTTSSHEMLNKDIVSSVRSILDDIEARVNSIRSIASGRVSAARFENFHDEGRVVFDGTILTGDNTVTLSPVYEKSRTYNRGQDIKFIKTQVLPAVIIGDRVSYPDQDLLFDYNNPPSPKRALLATSARGNRDIMISGTGNGFWRETYLVDAPVVHYYDSVPYDGVLILLTIEFTRARDVNSLVIDPFTDRELEIVKVRYLDENSNYVDARFFDGTRATGSGNTKIHLKNITNVRRTRAIQIWFNQRNYRRRVLRIDGNEFYENKVWNDMLAREYVDIASRYAPGDLTNQHRDHTVGGSLKVREYDKSVSKFVRDVDIDKTTKEVLNLDKKEDVVIDRVEYTLGAYSISPQTITYPGPGYGEFVSHREDDGYVADVVPLTDIQIDADFDVPNLSTVEFYIEDKDGKVSVPIAPAGTDQWREYVDPTGVGPSGIFGFTSMFPAVTGTVQVYKNSRDVTSLFEELIQTDPTGVTSSEFAGTGVYWRENDIFVAEYKVNHDDTTSSQRRATVVSMANELPSQIALDRTTDGTLKVDSNVLTLSRYPYAIPGECDTSDNTFPFTVDSVPLAVFNKIGKGDQRQLDAEGFIPFMDVDLDPLPGATWVLEKIVHGSNYQLAFVPAEAPANIRIISPLDASKPSVTTARTLTVENTTTVVGSIRINWSRVSTWADPMTYYNAFIYSDVYEPIDLQDAVLWPARYGKGAVIREEVMRGVFVGEDLGDPVNTLRGVFANTQCPVLVSVNGVVATDRTNYTTKIQDPLDPYVEKGDYEYFLSGDKVYMNADMEALQVQGSIDVLYRHITPAVRMKMRLRANEKGDVLYTPVVRNYTMKFRSQG
ncbi:MAG: hypothetical protein ACXABY_13250, partial [Candidatus Thorarchaeota archaeon]